MPGPIIPPGPIMPGAIMPGWWYPSRKLLDEFLPMKKPEKNTTATMNTTPATMPTQTNIEPARLRLSSYGGDSTARRAAAVAGWSDRDSMLSVMA
jgi:hypothetical protein